MSVMSSTFINSQFGSGRELDPATCQPSNWTEPLRNSVIVRLKDAEFAVIEEANHTPVLDRHPDPSIRLQQHLSLFSQ